MNASEPGASDNAPRGHTSLALLGFTSLAMLLLAVAFYGQSIGSTHSFAEQRFVGALCLAAAAPFVWLLVQLGRGRRAEAAMIGIVNGLLYVIGFGWIAVLLFLLSWGDQTLWIPAMGLVPQLLGLGAAVVLWRAQPAPTRALVSWWRGLAVPVICVVVPLIVSQLLRVQVEQQPSQRQAQAASAVALVNELQRCLRDRAARDGGRYVDRLERLSDGDAACSAALAAMALARAHTRITYRVAPAGAEGVRPAFMLCAQPTTVPDRGLLTVVADAGAVRQAMASDERREAVSCEAAWGGDAVGVVKRLQSCLLEQAATDAGFAPDLVTLRREVPGCLGEERIDPARPMDGLLSFGSDSVLLAQYLPEVSAPSSVSAYLVFVACPGRVDRAVINHRGEVQTSLAADWWLNDCRDPSGADVQLLADSAGFRRVQADAASAGPSTDTTRAAGAVPTVTSVAEPEPRFGDLPDLPARRADCLADAKACYGLALELERTIHLAGGNPYRVESLDEAQRALVAEANRALDRACQAGRWSACGSWADVLLQGRGLVDDPPQALRILQRACAGGSPEACSRSGELLEGGRMPTRTVATSIRMTPGGAGQPIVTHVPDSSRPGIPKDVAGAIAAFEAACALGETASCLRAARLTLDGGGQDAAQRAGALASLQELCERGQGFACSLLAQAATASGGAVLGRSVAEWRRRACALGERDACSG